MNTGTAGLPRPPRPSGDAGRSSARPAPGVPVVPGSAGTPVLVPAGRATGPADRTGPLPVPAADRTRPSGPLRPARRHRAAPGPAGRARRQRGVPRQRATRLVDRISLLQVVCLQVAVLAVLFTIRQPWPVPGLFIAGALVLTLLTAVRFRGRWLYQVVALGGRYLFRPRHSDLPEAGSKAPALLDLLVPGAAVGAAETGQGVAMTISHHGGLAAMLGHTGTHGDPVGALPLPVTMLQTGPQTDDGQQQDVVIRAVFHTGVRRDGPPKVWLAVHALRTVANPGDDELTLVLRNVLRRVWRTTSRAGMPVEPLDEPAAFAALTGLAHVTGGRTEVAEDWRFWRTGPVCQVTCRLDGLAELTDTQTRQLVGRLLAVTTGAAATVTVGARPGPTVDGVLRLAAPGQPAVEAALAAARDLLALSATSIRLTRLDGAHSRGVAASLPIGVFPL